MIDLSDIDFEAWVAFTFDHPVTDPAWYFGGKWEFSMPDAKTLAFCERLFRQPEFLLDQYPEEVLSQGFWFIPSAYGYLYTLRNMELEWTARESCILAMYSLFDRLFARNPLGDAAYMWWDSTFSFGGRLWGGISRRTRADRNRLRKTFLVVLRDILLTIDNRERQRSALHGLGHLAWVTRKLVGPIIDSYLLKAPDQDLSRFARICKVGYM